MTEETKAMAGTMQWAVGMVLQSGPEDRKRIGIAYREAQELVVSIPKDNGDARPRIEACFARSDAYRAVDNIACVGWILTALQERLNERNLPGSRKLLKILTETVKLLLQPETTIH